MPKTIISDASCFITLSNINELNLLHEVYGEVLTTPEIAKEFLLPPKLRLGRELFIFSAIKQYYFKDKHTNFWANLKDLWGQFSI